MENIVLTIHLILALVLIGVVLLQRSEGGGLGIGGGGGGGGGAMSGRSAATALGKVTWGLAIAFIITSMTLTILATRNSQSDSVIERLGVEATDVEQIPLPSGLDGNLLPPSTDDGPALPPAPE